MPRAAAASSRSGSRRTAWRPVVRRTASKHPRSCSSRQPGAGQGATPSAIARAEPSHGTRRRKSERPEVARPPESGSMTADRSGVPASRQTRNSSAASADRRLHQSARTLVSRGAGSRRLLDSCYRGWLLPARSRGLIERRETAAMPLKGWWLAIVLGPCGSACLCKRVSLQSARQPRIRRCRTVLRGFDGPRCADREPP
jgi:hypothetical protein